MENNNAGRIWEMDFARGLALVLMSYFHLIYDMKEFFGYNVSYEGNMVAFAGKLSAISFILISGISTTFSRSTTRRGFEVLAAALLITISTYLFNKDFFVVFGILHFIGLSMILSAALKRFDKYILLAAGILIIIIGYTLPMGNYSNDYLMIVGLRSQTFASSDYYPLVPYFGIFLVGMVLGSLLYAEKKSLVKPFYGHRIISAAGRNSLLVYLVHQPLILLILKLISQI